ncbi:MAG TPA: hypothetical protein IAC83_00650 [Euryarchaeota archaeon]|nr:hypothetical protein [Euryarchaeota archaeon]
MIDLPVKLAVCFLVLGLMVPVVMDVVDDADSEMSVYELRKDAALLEDAIHRAYSDGTVTSVELDIPRGQSLIVGGDGGNEYIIRLAVDGETVETSFIDSPMVAVIGGVSEISGDVVVRIDGTDADGVRISLT